jgi:hypothetical protein
MRCSGPSRRLRDGFRPPVVVAVSEAGKELFLAARQGEIEAMEAPQADVRHDTSKGEQAADQLVESWGFTIPPEVKRC